MQNLKLPLKFYIALSYLASIRFTSSINKKEIKRNEMFECHYLYTARVSFADSG